MCTIYLCTDFHYGWLSDLLKVQDIVKNSVNTLLNYYVHSTPFQQVEDTSLGMTDSNLGSVNNFIRQSSPVGPLAVPILAETEAECFLLLAVYECIRSSNPTILTQISHRYCFITPNRLLLLLSCSYRPGK